MHIPWRGRHSTARENRNTVLPTVCPLPLKVDLGASMIGLNELVRHGCVCKNVSETTFMCVSDPRGEGLP